MKTQQHGRFPGRRLAPWMLPLSLLAVFGPARAEEDSGATYGRVRYLDGALTIEQTSEGEVVDGTINTPVAAGDRALTIGGRAEIELADSSVVWMDADSRVEFRTLADIQNRHERTNLLALTQGSIRVESRDPEDPDAVFQIDTEAGSIYLLSGGVFRIDAVGETTTVSSYGGVAEFSGDGGSVLVRSGQRSSVQSDQSPSYPRRFNTQREDEFDRFCTERSGAYLHQGADEPYDEDLPEEVRPYAPELSFYGTWRTIPTYGRVWRPHYAGVWSPYHHGYWSWSHRSWVWVSYDPWGWAPYHYGRWDYAGDIGWFWVPGAVWSGAWVSFAVGPSYIGWCPLNYWNVPVFHEVWIVNRPTVSVGRLDPRGWRFVPSGRFAQRGVDTIVLRGDRLPRNTDLVVTQRLPQFDPRVIARRPERASSLVDAARRTRVAPPVSQAPGGALASFRAAERRVARGPIARSAATRPKSEPAPGQVTRVPRARTHPGTTASVPRVSGPSHQSPDRPGQGAPARRGPPSDRDDEHKTRPPTAKDSQPPREPEPARGRAMERLFEGTRTKVPPPPPQAARPPAANPSPTSDPQRATDPPPPPAHQRRGTTPPRRTPPKKPPENPPSDESQPKQ